MINDEKIIEGVLSEHGVFFSRSRPTDQWHMLLRLVVWKVDNSYVESSMFKINHYFNETDWVSKFIDIFKPGAPVKLSVGTIRQVGDLDGYGFCIGSFNEYINVSTDTYLLSCSERMDKPYYHYDKIFGKLRLDRSIGFSFETSLFWNDVSIHFSFGEFDGKIDPDCLATGHHLARHAKEWEEKWRSFALENIYNPTDDWYDEDVDWTPEAFINELGYPTISCDDGDSFLFYFDGGLLFGDHCITVSGNIKEGFKRWNIAG